MKGPSSGNKYEQKQTCNFLNNVELILNNRCKKSFEKLQGSKSGGVVKSSPHEGLRKLSCITTH